MYIIYVSIHSVYISVYINVSIYQYIYICPSIYYIYILYIYIVCMIITKKSPLSIILRHLRVVNLAFWKQRFDGCLFQVSFYLYNCFTTVARSILNDIKKQLNTINKLFITKQIHSLNIRECSKIPQWKILHRIETKQSTCNAHQWIGFYPI